MIDQFINFVIRPPRVMYNWTIAQFGIALPDPKQLPVKALSKHCLVNAKLFSLKAGKAAFSKSYNLFGKAGVMTY
ncbi:hypothetical protein OROMI_022632 [Orobanche minor]